MQPKSKNGCLEWYNRNCAGPKEVQCQDKLLFYVLAKSSGPHNLQKGASLVRCTERGDVLEMQVEKGIKNKNRLVIEEKKIPMNYTHLCRHTTSMSTRAKRPLAR